MQKITSSSELKDAIRLLEEKQSIEWQELKEHISLAREMLTPAKLIKNTFTEVFTLPNILKTILSGTIGLSAGYFTNKYFRGFPGSFLKKALSAFL